MGSVLCGVDDEVIEDLVEEAKSTVSSVTLTTGLFMDEDEIGSTQPDLQPVQPVKPVKPVNPVKPPPSMVEQTVITVDSGTPLTDVEITPWVTEDDASGKEIDVLWATQEKLALPDSQGFPSPVKSPHKPRRPPVVVAKVKKSRWIKLRKYLAIK
jgi:hypothetical protein